jgi:Cu/Ag efflux protein CusF
VRKLDLDTGKVTLKHGPIKSLDMPPMTMVFTADKALLTPLKVGDKVRFKAAHEGGKYVVTAIQSAP